MSYGVPSIVAADTGFAEVLGKELEDFVFDFETDSEKLVGKLHDLLSANDDLNDVSQKVISRAHQVIDEARAGYKNLVEGGGLPGDVDGFSDQVAEKMLHALKAAGEVSYFLSHDFKTLAQHYKMTPEELKKIIQTRKPEKKGFFSKVRNAFQCIS